MVDILNVQTYFRKDQGDLDQEFFKICNLKHKEKVRFMD